MVQAAIAIASALVAGLALGLFLRRGYTATPTKLTLPFVNVELAKFDALSPVKFFRAVSIVSIEPAVSPDDYMKAEQTARNTPIVLIHAGWTIVCESFVRRFEAYPTDERIEAAVARIGGQNAEFIKMYRDIHTSAIRHADKVDRKFAANYLARAPALAERIGGQLQANQNPLITGLLMGASETLKATP